MQKNLFLVFGLMISIAFTSCSGYSDAEKAEFDAIIQAHIAEQNKTFERLENGLYYHIIDKGDLTQDNIHWNNRVTFTYKGSFLSGDVFQAITEDAPLTFFVRELIVGWQDGLSLIKPNGEIILIIPPQLAYGSKNTDLIPPNSILQYHLKVLKVE
jgi:FKBP-type peptidyl-prolyl cis-trans isomerase FkpA